jgi:predicted DNA-binding transcriptional regulator AlpA
VHPYTDHGLKSVPAGPGTAAPERRWLRVSAAAAHLGIGVGTLNKLRIYGGGPKYAKIGHTVIYDQADLDAWATERKVRSTSEPVRAA